MLTINRMNLIQSMNWFEEHEATPGLLTLVIITYGKCLYWINGHKIVVEKGDMLLISSGASYYGKSVPTVFHEQYVTSFVLSDDAVGLIRYLEHGAYTKAKVGSYDLIAEKVRTVWQEWQEQAPYVHMRAAAFTLDALALWGRELDRGEETVVSLHHVERMKAFIQDHYRSKITKEHLGDWIDRSPNHAASLFRRVTGQTISSYVHQIRMRTAIYMLKESLLTVTEIAEYLGYADVTYFQRIFKRSTGLPPSAYLKERRLHMS